MTDREAAKVAVNTGMSEFPAILEYFFKEVGTFPLPLFLLRRDLCLGGSVRETIKKEVKHAESHLRAFKLKSILKQCKSLNSSGVKVEEFGESIEHNVLLSSPVEVAKYMGKVLMYHVPSGEYRLVSNAYKTALANLKEEDL
jgi:hypothetical protein